RSGVGAWHRAIADICRRGRRGTAANFAGHRGSPRDLGFDPNRAKPPRAQQIGHTVLEVHLQTRRGFLVGTNGESREPIKVEPAPGLWSTEGLDSAAI